MPHQAGSFRYTSSHSAPAVAGPWAICDTLSSTPLITFKKKNSPALSSTMDENDAPLPPLVPYARLWW